MKSTHGTSFKRSFGRNVRKYGKERKQKEKKHEIHALQPRKYLVGRVFCSFPYLPIPFAPSRFFALFMQTSKCLSCKSRLCKRKANISLRKRFFLLRKMFNSLNCTTKIESCGRLKIFRENSTKIEFLDI